MTSRYRWCAGAHPIGRSFVLYGVLFSAGMAAAGVVRAQDPFEIHVLEYEDLQPGEFTAEVHTNYIGAGPTEGQFHLTYELTGAITPAVSLGVMQLNGRLPGGGLQAAGWRLVPHLYAPRRWHWPVEVGLTAELAFEKRVWSPHTRSIAILPILEKRFGRFKFDANPTVEKALDGQDRNRGWDFALAARVGYRTGNRFTPSLECYSGLPGHGQVHQLVPGGDFQLAKNIIWNVGLGVGVTSAGDRLFYKSRLEISFGGKGRVR